MFVRDNIKLATRNFKTRKLRTFLTVLGISVGIGTTLFLVSLGYGLQKVLLEKIAKSDTLLTLDVASSDPNTVKIDKAALDDFASIPNVSEVSPQQVVMSQIQSQDVTSNVQLSSVNNQYFSLAGMEFLKGGKYENDNDKKIILSTGALVSLGISNNDEAVGKEVEVSLIIPAGNRNGNNGLTTESKTIALDKFVICGVVDDSSESLGYIPSGLVQNIMPDYYDEVKIKITNQKYLETIRSAISDRGFTVLALTDTIDQANKIFYIIQILLALFGIVAITVSAIGMFNTMTIALIERTNEIGIMKAIGASKSEIRFMFLTESILIGFLGGLGGIVFGMAGAFIVNAGFNFLARNLGGQTIDIFYTPFWFFIFIVIFSTIIGFITGIYPSERASRLNSLVALRYK